MRRPFWIGIVLACLLIMLSGCVGREAPKESAPEEALTVVDSAGRLVVIPQPVERVVSVFSYADVAMCILGVPEKLVGCSSFVKKNKEQFPQLAHAADVGWAWNPNWEVIYSLKPQVLLVPATWGEDISKYVDKCEPAGIKVVCLDLKPAAFNRDLMILAKIIGAEERARQHIAWRNHYIDLIRRRVRSLKEEEKVHRISGLRSAEKGQQLVHCQVLEVVDLSQWRLLRRAEPERRIVGKLHPYLFISSFHGEFDKSCQPSHNLNLKSGTFKPPFKHMGEGQYQALFAGKKVQIERPPMPQIELSQRGAAG